MSNNVDDMGKLRTPPQAIEAEASVLGSLLLDNEAFDLIADLLTEGDFYRLQHQLVFAAISRLINRSQAADVITVYEVLKQEGKGEEVGGLPYLNSLAQYVMSAGNVRRYAEVVRDRSILRNLIGVGDGIVASAFETNGRATNDILEEAEHRVLSIAESGSAGREDAKTLETQLSRFLETLDKRANQSGDDEECARTGFHDVDKLIDRLDPGDLIVLAGRPSMGKTSLAMNIAEHVALTQGLPVAVFSLEMSADQLTQRLVGSIGRVDLKKLREANLNESEWGRVFETVERLRNTVLDVHDDHVETVAQVRAAARRIKRKRKSLGLIVVDYLQLMNSSNKGKATAENRATEVGDISRGLKLLAKEMKCPVIALSQLNRGLEQRQDKRPMMSDLRESGAIEQDADVIMFVYRDEVYTKEACREPGVAEIIIAKQRNGPIGTAKLAWSAPFIRFGSLAR